MKRALRLALVPVAATGAAAIAQTRVTSAKEEFGHNFGDDYFLANYKQICRA